MNVQIQTTSLCNASCIMCPYPESWHRKNPGNMEDEVFSRILDQLSDVSINKICPYFQNEPLLDRKLFERIHEISRRLTFGLLEVSTNASAMTRDKSDLLADTLCSIPHEIWLSFHGLDKKTHEHISGLSFERCLENILSLLTVSQSIPLNIVIVGAGSPLNAKLAHEYNFTREEYLAFWEGQFSKHHIHKTPQVRYFRYHDRAGTIGRNSINMREIVRHDLTNFHCPRVDQWLHFQYNGDLVLCCDDYHREQVFGNIMADDLDTILAGEKYNHLRAQVTGLAPSPHDFICKRCINPGG